MKKISLDQLQESKQWKEAVIVFTEDSFDQEFSEESRSYSISSNAKYFNNDMIGNSLYGDCLDGQDNGVRLEIYMQSEGWKVEYCYITQ